MPTMVTVGGVRYREEDAKRLKLTPDTKAYAKKIAENEAPVGTSESVFKLSQAAATASRKAAGKADAVNSGVVGSGAAAPAAESTPAAPVTPAAPGTGK